MRNTPLFLITFEYGKISISVIVESPCVIYEEDSAIFHSMKRVVPDS